MLRLRPVLCALVLVLVPTLALPASAQEPPVAPPVSGGASDVGVMTSASLRFGAQAEGVCGEPGIFQPYGQGLGFLEPGKVLHWRLNVGMVGLLAGGGSVATLGDLQLCGLATVPAAGVPEVGTAGACDGVELTGRGRMVRRLWPSEEAYAIEHVHSPATGSVFAITGAIAAGPGQEPGRLVLLLHRRTTGMCLHKSHEATRVGSTYPQGGVGAELAGVLAYQLPRTLTPTGECQDSWGQVRRHLRGAGAGLHCPVPSEV